VYLFYIDESGNTGLDLRSADQPVHWLVAVAATPAQVKRVESEMQAIALGFFGDTGLEPGFEFKGATLFRGDGRASELHTNERVRAYGQILGLVDKYDLAIFTRGIDKAGYARRFNGKVPEHPHHRAFQYLVESIDRWLTHRQPEPSLLKDSSADPCHGLIIADEQHEMARALVQSFARWRFTSTDNGYKPRVIKYLIDTVHYVPSHDSWMIQLADCIAFVRARYEKIFRVKGNARERYTQSEQAVAMLWSELCQPCVAEDRVWPLD